MSKIQMRQGNYKKKAIFFEKSDEKFADSKICCTFASLSGTKRAFSSAGSEHLPYKQRVGGSNPSTPTGNFHSKVVLQVIVRPFFYPLTSFS